MRTKLGTRNHPMPMAFPPGDERRGAGYFDNGPFYVNSLFFGGNYMSWCRKDAIVEFSFDYNRVSATGTHTVCGRYSLTGFLGLFSYGFYIDITSNGTMRLISLNTIAEQCWANTDAGVVVPGEWAHFVVQRNGNSAAGIKFFKNGSQINSNVISDNLVNDWTWNQGGGSSNFQIASLQNSLTYSINAQTNKLNGYMTYLHIARNLRTPAQIGYEYKADMRLDQDSRLRPNRYNHEFNFNTHHNFFASLPVAWRGYGNYSLLPFDTASGFLAGSYIDETDTTNDTNMRVESWA